MIYSHKMLTAILVRKCAFDLMERNLCCFLIGHHDADESITNELRDTIERHIAVDGVVEFMVGNYGAFDRLSARILTETKRQHPQIRITKLLSYHPSSQAVECSEGFDGSVYPFDSPVPPKAAIVQANRWAVRKSGFLICYVRHFGNSREILEYARQREKRGLIHITNLGDK